MRAIKIPKAAWWVLAPLSWLWQYLIYVPAHLVWNALTIVIGLFDGAPGDRMVEPSPRLRPWFIERLR